MTRFHVSAALAAACLCALGAAPAFAHAVAGPRIFVGTLTVDDPGVSDELALPTIQYQRAGAGGGPGPVNQTNISGEFDKRITEDFALGIATGYNIDAVQHDKTFTGFDNIEVSAKYHVYTNAAHEFIASVGVIREFGSTGTASVGADPHGSTTPTLYFGKGLGDLPVDMLRPLAVTGTFSYQVADQRLKTSISIDPDTGLVSVATHRGNSNFWVAALPSQHIIPYPQEQVRDYGLPDFIGRLTLLVEISSPSPASSPSAGGTQFTIAPGVVYSGDSYQLAIEALIPGNANTGSNVGVIGQLHLYLDDIFPNSLGKPLFN